jgi:hypothetical protein
LQAIIFAYVSDLHAGYLPGKDTNNRNEAGRDIIH